ncbi:MAG: GMC oxidoreductase [Polyangiales bacterium]
MGRSYGRRSFLRRTGLLMASAAVSGSRSARAFGGECESFRLRHQPDVLVIGAGSAGSVIARRLVDRGLRVLLLEAGGADDNPAIHDPARALELSHGPDDWDYYSVPQAHAHARQLPIPRGKVLGGSHSLGMIYARGAPQDFDHWAALGNRGWSWADVLPIYKRIERYDGGISPLRGTQGLLDVSIDYALQPIQQSCVDASAELGIAENLDYNAESLCGVSKQQVTVRGGARLTTWQAYAEPVIATGQLGVLTRAWVHRLLFTNERVVGVELEYEGTLRKLFAEEIVLSAGAIDSPRLLLRSGIGPAEQLHALGIPVVVDSPGVGQNLHDHLLAPVIFTTDKHEVVAPPVGTSATQTHAFLRSRSGLQVPDMQPIHFSVPLYEAWMNGPASGFSLLAGMIQPKSRGTLRLAGAAPHDGVSIDLAALVEPDDLQVLTAAVRHCRELGRSAPLAREWGARELYPGPEVGDDDASLHAYVRRTANSAHHLVGTCRMGIDGSAVVDPKLRVRGVKGLRIADASIMPQVTTGHTNAPTIMIAEKAAELLVT